MVGTHFETHCRLLVAGRSALVFPKLAPSSTSAQRPAPSAFTLTELLVVITIIAILASLITGAALAAKKRADETAIVAELQQISAAMEDLKTEFGAYPPNGMITGLSNNDNQLAINDFVRMFKKAFPRNQEPDELIRALAGGPDDEPVVETRLDRTGMTGAEAIYFWLGGFSSDPSYPISGPGGPSFSDADGDQDGTLELTDEPLESRQLRYEFDLGRLAPRTPDTNQFDGRFIVYDDPRPGANNAPRRINFWRYIPRGSEQPIVYFDTSRHTPAEYDLDISGAAGANIYALKQLREGVSTPQRNADIVFVEDKKFQILHSGIDDIWGDDFARFHLDEPNKGERAYEDFENGDLILAPVGPFIGDVADTLASFMQGRLEEKVE